MSSKVKKIEADDAGATSTIKLPGDAIAPAATSAVADRVGPPLLVSVTEFEWLMGCGHTRAHEMIREGLVDVVRIDRRTRIVMRSIEALIERSIVRRDV